MFTQSAMSKSRTAVWLPTAIIYIYKSAQMQMTCALNNDMSVLMEILLKILKPNMDHGFPLPPRRMSAVEIETMQKNDERNHAFLSGGSHRVCLAESVYTCLYSSLQVVRAHLLQNQRLAFQSLEPHTGSDDMCVQQVSTIYYILYIILH